MIKVALIGSGRMGQLHAANIAASPRFDLVRVADHFPERATTLAGRYGALGGSLDSILADKEVQGVVVATSTDALLETSLACLRAGKPVFSEKPLSLTLETLLTSPAHTDRSIPSLFVGFNRRFDPHMAELQRAIAGGDIGTLETLHIVSHDPAIPSTDFIPTSGGLFKDFTVHDFDTARWMIGEPFTEVFALAGCLIDPVVGELGDVDTAKLLLRTAGGKICFISNSRRTNYGYDQRVEAFGAKGCLRLDNLRENSVARLAVGGTSCAPFFEAFPQRYFEAYRRELDHFADIIETGERPRTGTGDAIAALRLAEAAALSVQSGRPVSIPSEEIEYV